jgi:uncharacterized membrane protein YukC
MAKNKKKFNVQRFVAIIALLVMIASFIASCLVYF